MVNRPFALLCLCDNIALNLITVNVDNTHEFPTRDEGPNQSSNCLIYGPESTNSNVTQQSRFINGPERKEQTKIDGPESNVINHLPSAQIDIQSGSGSNYKFLSEYPKLFYGKIALMRAEVSITLKDDARPYHAPIRRVVQAMEKL